MQKELSKSAILHHLTRLHLCVPTPPTAVAGIYDLPDDLVRNASAINFSEASIQAIADHIGFYLGLIRGIKIRILDERGEKQVWVSSNNGTISSADTNQLHNYSGLYFASGQGHKEIYLIRRYNYKLEHIIAILVHEYAHHYLFSRNIYQANRDDNELMTDLAAAYLGLGYCLVPGYEPIYTRDYLRNVEQRSYIGYVSATTIASAILLSTPLRGWNPKEVMERFHGLSYRLDAFIHFLPYRIRKYWNNKKKHFCRFQTDMVIVCDNCGSKNKIGTHSVSMKPICGKCKKALS